VGPAPSVDNSTLPAFPPIGNQGSLNSCTAWASTYYMTTFMTGMARGCNNKGGSYTSTTFSPKWTYNMINGGGNNGTSYGNAFKLLLLNGAASLADVPYSGDSSNSLNYTQWSTDPAVWRHAIGNRIGSQGTVRHMDTDAGVANLKGLLATGYVCVYGTEIHRWVFSTVGKNPNAPSTNAEEGKPICTRLEQTFVNGQLVDGGGHAMTVVGYNDNIWVDINGNGKIDPGELGAFRIANSWGTNWKPPVQGTTQGSGPFVADGGFTWLAYDALKPVSAVAGGNNTNREAAWAHSNNDAFYVTARTSYTPKLVAQFTLKSSDRGALAVGLGRSALTATTPFYTWTPGAINDQGGDLAFNGTATTSTGTFAFDLTDIYYSGNARYYVSVTNSGPATTLSDFRLTDASGNTKATANTGIPATVAVEFLGAFDHVLAVPRTIYAYADIADSFADATQVYFPGSYPEWLEAGANQYYTFTLSSKAPVMISSSGTTDTVGYLYNSNKALLAYDDNNGSSSNFLISTTLPAGTYYVRVAGHSSSTSGAYNLNGSVFILDPPVVQK
jgi:hypothetical protein